MYSSIIRTVDECKSLCNNNNDCTAVEYRSGQCFFQTFELEGNGAAGNVCYVKDNRKYEKIHPNRYCAGYTKSAFDKKTTQECYDWAKKADPTARYFFFRLRGNNHCSPCPLTYEGGTQGLKTEQTGINVYDMHANDIVD